MIILSSWSDQLLPFHPRVFVIPHWRVGFSRFNLTACKCSRSCDYNSSSSSSSSLKQNSIACFDKRCADSLIDKKTDGWRRPGGPEKPNNHFLLNDSHFPPGICRRLKTGSINGGLVPRTAADGDHTERVFSRNLQLGQCLILCSSIYTATVLHYISIAKVLRWGKYQVPE